MSRRAILGSLVAFLLACAIPASASAAPTFTLQNCFSATATSACATGAPLGQAVSAVPSPDGAFVYGVAAGGATPGGATLYTRNAANGTLTRVSGTGGCFSATAPGCTTFASLLAPFDLVFDPTDPTGAYGYFVGNTGTLEILARNVMTGAFTAQANCLSDAVVTCITPVSGTNVLTGARAMIFSPDGANAYVASSGRNTGTDDGVTRFGITSHIPVYQGCTTDSAAGACANGVGLKGGTDQMAISPDGKFLYTTGVDDNAITILDRNTTTGMLVPGPCYSNTDTGECSGGWTEVVRPYAALIPPDDPTKLYIGTGTGVSVFSRSVTTGAISHLQCLNGTGANGCVRASGLGIEVPNQLALSPDGTHLALTQAGPTGGVVFLERNKTTGLLSQLPGTAGCITSDGHAGTCRLLASLGGVSVVHAAPDASQFYLGASATGAIAGFRLDNPPVCTSRALTTRYQTAVSVPLSCTDADGDAITLRIVHAPGHGGVGAIDQAHHSILYNPLGGFSGADSFTFQAQAHGLVSAIATATVTVGAAPPPPPPPPPPVIASPIEASWRFGSTTTVVRLTVKSVPKGATVKLICTGRKHVSHHGGCAFTKAKSYKEPHGKSALALKSAFKHAKLKVGTTITIDITAPGSIGKEARYVIRARKLPKLTHRCFPVGSAHARTKCS